jgi:hypothetical protein
MLIVIMLSVIMLNVVVLGVVAPIYITIFVYYRGILFTIMSDFL